MPIPYIYAREQRRRSNLIYSDDNDKHGEQPNDFSNKIMGIGVQFCQDKVDDIQNRINKITEKAKRGVMSEITVGDKSFLYFLYISLIVGGHFKHYHEAAQLLMNYLSKSKKTIKIEPGIYQRAKQVRQEIDRQKNKIAKILKSTSETTVKEGSGKLMPTGEEEKGLHYADNQFYLRSITRGLPKPNENRAITTWRIWNIYDFQSFEQAFAEKKDPHRSKFKIPNLGGKELVIPDGLSKFLVNINMAAEFEYFAEWEEEWTIDTR